jgi:hypothetical protein
LRDRGFNCVPIVLGSKPDKGLALYSWLDGEPFSPGSTELEAVLPFVNLVRDLLRLSRDLSIDAAPFAAEACVSLKALREQIENRINRLIMVPDCDEVAENMREFINNIVRPLFQTRLTEAEAGYARLGRSSINELTDEELILSPSDFGFHNAIRLRNGDVAFLDFEYFGWDDPVKLMADFVMHPGMDLNEAQRNLFLSEISLLFAKTDALERYHLLKPLFAVKWATIILNEFLPVNATSRHFAVGLKKTVDLRSKQLEKARIFLKNN